MQLAELRLYDPATSGAGGSPGSFRTSIPFQFNPKEVSIQKSAKWESKPAKQSQKAGPPEFISADACKLTLEMFFDATDTQNDSVLKAVESLFSCCVPTDETAKSKKPMPPIVILHWGSVMSFPGYVTSVNAKYTLFNAQGLPIRATCSVSMQEMPTEPWRQNPTSGSDSVRRSRRLRGGDTLASVAHAEYGDPAMWRSLAVYNRIDDPLRCRPGSLLLLPSPEELT